MNKIAKEIKDYWFEQSHYFMLDTEVLDAIIPTLSTDETLILNKGRDACFKSSELEKAAYQYAVSKAFNRHNDVISGYTVIDGDAVLCSEKSSITELDISIETLISCNKHCIYHVCDVEKDILPSLPFEAIADLTGAIISYNEVHGVPVEN